MKISFNSTIFSKEKNGGISRYFVYLAKKLIENKVDIKIISVLHKNKFLKLLSKKYYEGLYLSNYPSIKLIENLNLGKFNSYNEKHSVDIIHDTYYTPGIIKKNIKKVITVHDLIHEKFKYFYRNSEELISLKQKAFKDCDHFICVSNNTKEDLKEFYNISSDKITVINHGADHFVGTNSQIDFQISSPFLLYVGNRERYKNFDFFLKVFAKTNRINQELKLICFGGGKFNKKERRMISDLSMSKKIFQINGDDKLLANHYLQASALVVPSVYEGFGLPLLEAMRFSCPIFCSDIEVFKDICGDNAVYFSPYKEMDLIEKLEKEIFNTTMLKDIASKNLIKSNNYSWDKTCLKTMNVYKNLI
tara:strand:+ start:1604 stop:2689 length:1086 start_codon:yes stop_codon:yes gene_type:complete